MTSSLNEKKKRAYKIFESLKTACPDSNGRPSFNIVSVKTTDHFASHKDL